MSLISGTKIAADKVLKIGARLQFFSASEESGVRSRIEDITENRIMAAMPRDNKGVPVIPEAGEQMLCKVAGEGCFYRFMAKFIDKGMDGHLPVWYIQKPELVQKVQNREFVRVSVDYPLIIRPLDENGALGDMKFARMTDISGGGLAVTFDEELPVMSKAVLELDNIPGVGMLRITGQVMRCTKLKYVSGDMYQVGLKFLDVSRLHQNKLIKFVFELQRKSLAKGIGKK